MTVLLHVTELAGHLRVYVRTVARALAAAGHEVVVSIASRRACKPFCEAAGEVGGYARILGTADGFEAGGAGEFRSIEGAAGAAGADVIILLDADHLADQLIRAHEVGVRPLQRPAAGVFSRTAEWYPGEPFYFTQRPNLSERVKRRLRPIRNRLIGRRTHWQRLFEDALLDGRVLDRVIVKDPRVADRYPGQVSVMPEIYEDDVEDEMSPVEEQVLSELRRRSGQPVLLYYGTGTWYKGFDYFVNLAVQDPEVLAVHVGLPHRDEVGKDWAFDVDGGLAQLRADGRLLETSGFATARMTRETFAVVDRYVSFHRLSGSSGTVLSAASRGRPVMVPSDGLLGEYSRKYTLGPTYRPLDPADLRAVWEKFKRSSPDAHGLGSRRFAAEHGVERAGAFFQDVAIDLAASLNQRPA